MVESGSTFTAGGGISPQNNSSMLTDVQKHEIRNQLIEFAKSLIGVTYVYGAEWVNHKSKPIELDCSELVEGVYNHIGLKMPDGSQNQFDFTIPVKEPKPADLAFFGKSGKPSKIYHAGLVWGGGVIEARAYDPMASFDTGKVIVRPIERWIGYSNFCGFRSHPKLI